MNTQTNRTQASWAARVMALAATLGAAAVVAHPGSIMGQTPEERGRAVAEAADANDLGWSDNASNMRMILRNRDGQESTRTLKRMALETAGEGLGDRSVIVFETPRDIQGTALLSHTRILDPDDQWLYLPALRRVKRISSGNKSGPFVGSEFAYEDLVSQEVEKYDYKWLRAEECAGFQCDVVERYPLYERSGYTRHVVWWDRAENRIQRVDFYDRKDTLLKTLSMEGYQEYGDGFWRPDRMIMENHQSGKTTELVFEDWVFGSGLTEDDFTPSRLRRSR